MNSSFVSQWMLRVADDLGAEVSIALDETPKCFGRGEEQVDIRLLSSQVSRRHAEIWVDSAGQLLLRDLGSTNGTAVNDARVDGTHVVRHGDAIRIARWVFTAHNPEAAAAQVDEVMADAETGLISSMDSIVALDALLDSQGNLRDESELAVPQKTSAQTRPQISAAPVPEAKPVEPSFDPSGQTLAQEAIAPIAPAPAPVAATKPAIKAELKPAPVAAQAAVQAPAKAPAKPQEETLRLALDDATAIATASGLATGLVDDFVDSHAGRSLFSGSQAGLDALEDSRSGTIHHSGARASDLHLVGEGRAPGVSAADLCAVQAFADRQLVVPNPVKRRRLLCEFVVGPTFNRNITAIVAVQEGKIESVCGPAASLPKGELHIEKALVRKAAEEKRAVVAWDAHFADGSSAVAVCCPLSNGEFLYAMTSFETATPAWMALLAQTAFMDRLIRKSWQAIEKIRKPAALSAAA